LTKNGSQKNQAKTKTKKILILKIKKIKVPKKTRPPKKTKKPWLAKTPSQKKANKI
jgi:hypothetical protein